MSKKKILAIPADLYACGNYRIIEPYNKLAKTDHEHLEFEVFDYKNSNITTLEELLKKLSEYDAVIFQRIHDKRLLSVMYALKQIAKKKVYLEIDDDMFNISQDSPAWNVWRKGGDALAAFSKALEIADYVHVSTPELIGTYYGRNKNFEVFYNALDVDSDKYREENSRRQELPTDKTVVMWTGSSTHLSSLLEIKDAFKQVFDERPNALFALCSNREFLDLFNLRDEQKIYIPHVKMDEYAPIPSMGDIGLTPVKLNKFNDAKSELKCLEHAIWKVPCVSSPAAPYVRFNGVSDGANLLAKKNKWQMWSKQVAELIDNPRLREELGEKAYRTVLEHYNLDKINEKRIKFYEKELLSD